MIHTILVVSGASAMLAQISVLKFAWTLAAFIGVIVTFALFFMSITDYKLLRKRGLNGWRKYVGKTSIFIFLAGFLTQVVYFVAGVLALTQSNSKGSSLIVRHITQTMFLCGAICAIILSTVIFYRRLYILDLIEKTLSNNTENPKNVKNESK